MRTLSSNHEHRRHTIWDRAVLNHEELHALACTMLSNKASYDTAPMKRAAPKGGNVIGAGAVSGSLKSASLYLKSVIRVRTSLL